MNKLNQSLEPHVYSLIFPDMDGKSFGALVEDIRSFGQLEPIMLFDGRILDGRHRYKACQELGIHCVSVPFNGVDPLAYVVSHNLRRRHMSESQRAMVAASMAKLSTGGQPGNKNACKTNTPSGGVVTVESRQAAADALNVGTSSVDRARLVQRDGIPEVVEAVNKGDITVNRGAQIVKWPKEVQLEVLNKAEEPLSDPPQTTGRINYKPALGDEIALKVITMLKRITDKDSQAKQAFQQIINYCKQRLSVK